MSSSRLIPLNFDVGNLAVFDPSPISDHSEDGLRENCRQATQELLEKLLALPAVDALQSLAVKEIPEPTIRLPRALPLPKPQAMTRWQQFAKKKGIVKHKKGAMQYDDRSERWMARHGKNSARNVHAREDAWIKDWTEGENFDD